MTATAPLAVGDFAPRVRVSVELGGEVVGAFWVEGAPLPAVGDAMILGQDPTSEHPEGVVRRLAVQSREFTYLGAGQAARVEVTLRVAERAPTAAPPRP